MPQNYQVPAVTTAIIDSVSNEVSFNPASTLKLGPGTAKIGKVETLSPAWGNVVYEDVAITVAANTAANTFVNGAYIQNKNGIRDLILTPIVKSAASAINTNLEVSFYWLGDGSDGTRIWVTRDEYGTASNGYIPIIRNIITFPIAVSSTGIKNNSTILIPCLGDMFGLVGRLTNTSTTPVQVAFNSYYR